MIINDTVTGILACVGLAIIVVITIYFIATAITLLSFELQWWYHKRDKSKTNKGYLYIKAKNEYVEGVVGTDIKLSFKQKLQILFSKGISVCIGKGVKRSDNNGE